MRLRVAGAALVALALLVGGCGGGGTTTVIDRTVTETVPAEETDGSQESTSHQGGSTSDGEAGDGEAEQPSRTVHLRSFRSPSGNIGCQMYGGGARCDIRKRDWAPPPHPPGCSQQVDYGQGLTVSRRGQAAFVCAGDTALDPSAASLAYGTASEVDGTECLSREEGISCVNQSGHGFFISSESYQVF